MARKAQVWQAPKQALEPLQGLSGNKVNGLGETQYRSTSPFFWHEPQYHGFGAMQAYTLGLMYGLEDAGEICEAFRINPDFNPNQQVSDKNRQFLAGPPPTQLAEKKVENTPEQWTQVVKDFALKNADVVGIAHMRPEFVVDGFEIKDQYVIVVGAAHDYEEISQAPSVPENNNRAIVEIGKQYSRAATVSAELNNFIREQGLRQYITSRPTAKALLMIPAAIDAGLGELGKHGSLINRKLGSSFRLAAVTTDLPLIVDEVDEFGGNDFCVRCQVCREACPPDAIFDEKQWVRGKEKWYVDFDKCIPYFAESRGSGICIAVCPWSRPGIADKLVVKMAKRKQRITDKDE